MVEIEEELLTQDEVAKMLRTTTKTLRIWTNTHKHRELLAPYRFSTRHVLYPKANVLKFMEKAKSVTGF